MVGSDAHLAFGPVAADEPAKAIVSSRVGRVGTAVRFTFTADGRVSVDNPLSEVVAALGEGPEDFPGGVAAPIPGVRLDPGAAAAAFVPLERNDLYVDVRGGAVTAYLNGTPFFTALDSAEMNGGPVAVAGEGGVQVTHVRNDDGPAEAAALADETGFAPVPLEPGLPGWSGDTAGYVVEDGILTCEGGGNVYLPGDPDPDGHRDYALRFEFKLPPGGNNGVGLRCVRGQNAAYSGMESQILDNAADRYAGLQPWQAHGSIYGVVPALRGALEPTGHWNEEEIRCVGDRVTVILNGTTIVDADLREAAPDGETVDGKPHPGLFKGVGAVGFLGHGAPVAWRNLRLKSLPTGDGANAANDAANADRD